MIWYEIVPRSRDRRVREEDGQSPLTEGNREMKRRRWTEGLAMEIDCSVWYGRQSNIWAGKSKRAMMDQLW